MTSPHTDFLSQFTQQAMAQFQDALLSASQLAPNNLSPNTPPGTEPTATDQSASKSNREIASRNGLGRLDQAQFFQQQLDHFAKQSQLLAAVTQAVHDQTPIPELTQSDPDPRFEDADWRLQPFYNYLRQSYLLNAELAHLQIEALAEADAEHAEQWRFYARQVISALSPANFAWSNPEVARDAIDNNGENIRNGINNFLEDWQRSPNEALRMTQVDSSGFAVGKNVASTPGKVIYRNDLIELIQYTPTTAHVFQRPLLFVPPFINKFYVLDLNEKKSLVRWLVAQGFTLFMISWVNPDETLRDKGFSDYVREGVLAALDTVESITGAKSINAAGYCVGGTLLATTQAWLKARGDNRLNAISLLTTLLDFSKPGDIGNYTSVPMLENMQPMIKKRGYLDGRVIASSFNFLRENSLFWPNFINNYLKGKKPPAFDLLFWNSDSTHLSAKVFDEYVLGMYGHNQLCQADSLVIEGTAIDLGIIDCPAYCLAAQADHIVLWRAAYDAARLLSGPTRFVLAGSGHIAGVVNPPEQQKYGFHIADRLPASSEEWLADSAAHAGSWWSDWLVWLTGQSGEKVVARAPGSARFPALAEAPGDYVMVRI